MAEEMLDEIIEEAAETIEAIEAAAPIAMVQGQAFSDLPEDLYIPPDALKIFLDAFEGPLDLLLYLIRRHNLDILDIPILKITEQYMAYIDLMQNMRFELAAEYLLMAAILAEIKSRMLLPRPETDDEDAEDPRADLMRRLQEYERFKKAAVDLEEMPRMEREIFYVQAETVSVEREKPAPEVDLRELLLSLQEVMKRVDLVASHQIAREPLSVRERMGRILSSLEGDTFVEFTALFDLEEGRAGVIVTFISILELVREGVIELIQAEPYNPIHVRAVVR